MHAKNRLNQALPARTTHKGFTLLELLVVVAIVGALVGLSTLAVNTDDDYKRMQSLAHKYNTFFEMLADEAVFQSQDLGLLFLQQKIEIFKYDYEALSPQQRMLQQLQVQEDRDGIGFGDGGLSDASSVEEISEWKPYEHEIIKNQSLPEGMSFRLNVEDQWVDLEAERNEELVVEPNVFIWASGEAAPFELEVQSQQIKNMHLLISSDGLGRFVAKVVKEGDQ